MSAGDLDNGISPPLSLALIDDIDVLSKVLGEGRPGHSPPMFWLLAVALLATAEPPPYDDVVFHAQQPVEKSVKGFGRRRAMRRSPRH